MTGKVLVSATLSMAFLLISVTQSVAQVVYLDCAMLNSQSRLSVVIDVNKKTVVWFGKTYNVALSNTRAEWVTEHGYRMILDRVTGRLNWSTGTHELQCVVTQKAF